MYSQEADGGRHANGDVADLRHLGDVAAVTDTLQQIPGRWGVAGVAAGTAGLLARPAGLRRTVLLTALVPPAQQVLGDVTARPAPQERPERQAAATERRAAGRRRRQRRLRLPGADQVRDLREGAYLAGLERLERIRTGGRRGRLGEAG